MDKLKKFLAQIKLEMLLVIVGMLLFGLISLAFMLRVKNKTIERLEQQLIIKTAKLDLEKLMVKHDSKLEEIKQIREQKEEVRKELAVIENRMTTRLAPSMSAEEIAAKFCELGL